MEKYILEKSSTNSQKGFSYNESDNWVKNNLVFILIFIATTIVFGLLGVMLGRDPQYSNKINQNKGNEDNKKIEITYEIFNHPMLSEWSGRVLGRVKTKDEVSLTITPVKQTHTDTGVITREDANVSSEMKIIIFPQYTKLILPIRTTDTKPSESKAITISDIDIGSIIEGSVSFNLNSSSNQYEFFGETITLIERK